ncbi:MAG: cation diffusion facilitator family transporter [Cryomorphaceae bacterium]|jgi:cation diffusion facilitator family transporter
MSSHHHCAAEATTAQMSRDPIFRRVLWFALVVNASMFVVEIIASQISNSVSLQADALDFFADSANYAISLFVIGMSIKSRARAALIKGFSMAAFGLFVLFTAVSRAYSGELPETIIMGSVGFMALIANVSVAVALYSFRGGDSNMQSIWLCSRNDAIGNLAVLVAAAGVFSTATRWPDLIVAAIIAILSLSAAYKVIRMAISEIRDSDHTHNHT